MTELPHINTIGKRQSLEKGQKYQAPISNAPPESDGLRVGEQIASMSDVPELEDYILSRELHSAQEWIDALISNPKPTCPVPMQKLGSLLAACAEMTWGRGYYFLSMRFDALAIEVNRREEA